MNVNRQKLTPRKRPDQPWIMTQTWKDVLFAHWPVPVNKLQSLVPSVFTVDAFEGEAWIGIVSFGTSNMRLRGTPPIPFLSTFAQVNLRTYVTYQGKSGVYFFSQDVNERLLAETLRFTLHLSYFEAEISYETRVQELVQLVQFKSKRIDKQAAPGQFEVLYRPDSAVYYSKPGTLEHWLTERYCLFHAGEHGKVYRGDIDHSPWPLQRAQAEIGVNTLASAIDITLPAAAPLLHFADEVKVHIWMFVQLTESCK